MRHLRQLIWISKEDEVPRRRSDRELVGECELAALIDEERVNVAVELLAREQEQCAGDQLRAAARRSARRCEKQRHNCAPDLAAACG